MIARKALVTTAEQDNKGRETEWTTVDALEEAPSRWVVARGPVESLHQGLTHWTVHVKIGDRAVIRVRWSAAERGAIARVGQEVSVFVPTEGVFLRAGHWRPGKERWNRWNRWNGRIVLVGREEPHPLVTVKLHGERLTLTSQHPVQGLDRRPQVWDEVEVLVDPAQVCLGGRYPSKGVPPYSS